MYDDEFPVRIEFIRRCNDIASLKLKLGITAGSVAVKGKRYQGVYDRAIVIPAKAGIHLAVASATHTDAQPPYGFPPSRE